MKKVNLLLSLSMLVVTLQAQQKKIKYETVFFEDATVESASARFNITSAASENDFIKAKVKVTNFTDKTLVIKPEECFFSTSSGDIASKDRWVIIAPREQETKVIDIRGAGIKTDLTTLKIKGLYVCTKPEVQTGTPMPLPPEKEIRIGNFVLTLDTWDRDGKEIMVKYKVRYIGTQIGMCAAGKVTLKSPEGEFKNQKEKDRVHSLKKNEDVLIGFLFNSDSKKDNTILWNDAFTESVPEKAEEVTIELKMDEMKTKEKN